MRWARTPPMPGSCISFRQSAVLMSTSKRAASGSPGRSRSIVPATRLGRSTSRPSPPTPKRPNRHRCLIGFGEKRRVGSAGARGHGCRRSPVSSACSRRGFANRRFREGRLLPEPKTYIAAALGASLSPFLWSAAVFPRLSPPPFRCRTMLASLRNKRGKAGAGSRNR